MRRKAYGNYLIGKVFTRYEELENERLYDITRLMHEYAPSKYIKLNSQFLDEKLCDHIDQHIKDDYGNGALRHQ